LIRLFLILAALAGPVAACPTAADLDRGVTFVRQDGSRQDHRRLESGLIEIGHVRPSGVQVGWSLTAYGLHVLEAATGGTTPIWSVEQSDAPAPQLDVMQRTTRPTEGPLILQMATYTQPVSVVKKIGLCELEVWRVAQYTNGAALVNFRAFDWYPTLGTGVVVGMRMGEVEEITSKVESMRW